MFGNTFQAMLVEGKSRRKKMVERKWKNECLLGGKTQEKERKKKKKKKNACGLYKFLFSSNLREKNGEKKFKENCEKYLTLKNNCKNTIDFFYIR